MKRYGTVGRFHISKWTAPEDTVSWTIKVDKAATYNAFITYSAVDSFSGRPYSVSFGGELHEATVHSTGKWYRYGTFSAGTFHVEKPGTYTLTVRPENADKDYLMYLKSMMLVPEKD